MASSVNVIKKEYIIIGADGRWLVSEDRITLYDNPIGSGSYIYRYWFEPASELGLPLLEAIYDNAILWEGDTLIQAEKELDILRKYWETNLDKNLYDELFERYGYMKKAIRIARSFDAAVVIT